MGKKYQVCRGKLYTGLFMVSIFYWTSLVYLSWTRSFSSNTVQAITENYTGTAFARSEGVPKVNDAAFIYSSPVTLTYGKLLVPLYYDDVQKPLDMRHILEEYGSSAENWPMLQLMVVVKTKSVVISVNDTVIYQSFQKCTSVSTCSILHVMVLNQETGSVMAHETFQESKAPQSDDEALAFLKSISKGRVMIFATQGAFFEAFQMSAKYVALLGSLYVSHMVGERDKWVFVMRKYGEVLTEEYSNASQKYVKKNNYLLVQINLKLLPQPVPCKWTMMQKAAERRSFCERFEGYYNLCKCHTNVSLEFIQSHSFSANHNVSHIPWLVLAPFSSRALFSSLSSLTKVLGLNASLLSVHIRGFKEEPVYVAKLFNVSCVQHPPLGRGSGSVMNFYKAALMSTFKNFPTAHHVIVIEEGATVDPDIMRFFNAATDVLTQDNLLSAACAFNPAASSGNYQNVSSPSWISAFPGTVWMISRVTFYQLREIWPTSPKVDFHQWLNDLGRSGQFTSFVPMGSLAKSNLPIVSHS